MSAHVQYADDIMVIKDVLRPRNPANGHDQHGFVVYERLVLPIDEVRPMIATYPVSNYLHLHLHEAP